ncbi:T9SS type A sorting domain-containing protein [Taibaiella lutea]|uniref:T9SS type A sorting domain-containing protein n=1 Tax=Taibaiella lutea TaxID=2608001 RepID=A0A5M6CNX5_9BACT|nr:T9SS type A sorting domain-containing protein [Taibaiella lutea]KAA5534965.1 T9SS type A sorting domain-containing protein [Taibaiella lutea]
MKHFYLLLFFLLAGAGFFTASGAPVNDDCSGALPLTMNVEVTDNTLTATASVPVPACGTANADVWYSFQAPVSDLYLIAKDVSAGSVSVYSGSCAGLSLLQCKPLSGYSATPISLTGLSVGNTYFVRIVSSYSFSLQLKEQNIITSMQSGNWNDASTWVGGVVPSLVDTAIIAGNHTVTIAATAEAGKVIVQANGNITLNDFLVVHDSLNNMGTINGGGHIGFGGFGDTGPVCFLNSGNVNLNAATGDPGISVYSTGGLKILLDDITGVNNFNIKTIYPDNGSVTVKNRNTDVATLQVHRINKNSFDDVPVNFVLEDAVKLKISGNITFNQGMSSFIDTFSVAPTSSIIFSGYDNQYLTVTNGVFINTGTLKTELSDTLFIKMTNPPGANPVLADSLFEISEYSVVSFDNENLYQCRNITYYNDGLQYAKVLLNNSDLKVLQNSVINQFSLVGGGGGGFIPFNLFYTNGSGGLIRYVTNTPVDYPVYTSMEKPATVKITNSGTGDWIKVIARDSCRTNGTSGPAITDSVVNQTWHITEAVNGGSNLTLAFYWSAGNHTAGFNTSQCAISHYTNGAWDVSPALVMANYDNATGWYYVSRNNITSLSPFRVSSATSVPLPLTSMKLTAAAVSNSEISLATEVITDKDIIVVLEYLSAGKWQDLTTLQFSTMNRQFTYFHNGLNKGNHQYRLHAIDNRGASHYSHIASVNLPGSNDGALRVYPNPAHTMLFFSCPAIPDEIKWITVTDLSGKTIAECNNCTSFEVAKWPAGIYFLSVEDKYGISKIKFVVSK